MFRIMQQPKGLSWLTVTTVLCACLLAVDGRGEVAQWSEPALDTWAYTNGFGGGSRLQAPSFGGIFVAEGESEFSPNGAGGPARLGSMLIAFETTEAIEAGLPPSRYAIESVVVTARMADGSTGSLPYSEQPISPSGLLSEALSGGISSQKPMELFGVGFRSGYEGFALGVDQTGTRFSEATPAYGNDGYRVFPVVGDGGDGYRDVSNNLTGGFSATEPQGETAPFDADPWSVGTAGLNEGESVPANTTYTFDLDLGLHGVTDYLQESLASGVLGFMLSSVHPAAQPGSAGGGSYPQWFAKEAVGVFSGAEAATLTIDYAILPIAGDYDGNGFVEPADYDTWSASYGLEVTPDTGADGNGDGFVDAADYTVWRDAIAGAVSESLQVPEPTTGIVLLMSVLSVGVWSSRRASHDKEGLANA